MKTNFAQMIKDKRLSLDESQKQFAQRFNVSQVSIYYWESGRNEAPYRVIDFCLDIYFTRNDYGFNKEVAGAKTED